MKDVDSRFRERERDRCRPLSPLMNLLGSRSTTNNSRDVMYRNTTQRDSGYILVLFELWDRMTARLLSEDILDVCNNCNLDFLHIYL